MSSPFKIGLTGGIGSGKSTAAAEFARLGAEIVSGDELGKLSLEGSADLLRQVIARFGEDIVDDAGRLRRRTLGERAFATAEHARWLTEITFPEIFRLWTQRLHETRAAVIVFDAALIFEWGIHDQFDYLILVHASAAAVAQRVAAAGRFTPAEAAARLAVQISVAEKMSIADIVLLNEGTRDELAADVQRIWSRVVVPKIGNAE